MQEQWSNRSTGTFNQAKIGYFGTKQSPWISWTINPNLVQIGRTVEENERSKRTDGSDVFLFTHVNTQSTQLNAVVQ